MTTTIDEVDGTAALDLAFEVAAHFGVKHEKANTIVREVGVAVARWHEIATAVGLGKNEIGRMASAFEHDELKQSIKQS